MTAVPREHPEPVDRFAPGTGSGLSAILAVAVPRVRTWAGDGLLALVLSGSHATGEAVWIAHEGRRVSLSDLDLYAVLADEGAARAALRASTGDRVAAHDPALREAGLLAPLEVAFVSSAGLARMPARPGTVELARSGRVLVGEPAFLERLPRWTPEAIDGEERLLLLENRAFELLWAHLTFGPGLAGLRAWHAVLKTALELAASRALMAHELPAGSPARVARARALGAPPGAPSWLEGAWDALEAPWRLALRWRGGQEGPGPEDFRRTWRAVVRAWAALWWAHVAGPDATRDPWTLARSSAARGSLARRLRRSLRPSPDPRAGAGSLGSRLAHAPAGTPLNRLHGVAAVLLLAAAQSPGEPVLPSGAFEALRRLGFASTSSFADAARRALREWGREIPAGAASGGPA